MISYILLECSPGSEEEVISELNSIVGVVEVNGVLGNMTYLSKYQLKIQIQWTV